MALNRHSTTQASEPGSPYLLRYVDAELDQLQGAPAIAIDGPKGVGKSETTMRRANSVFRLDNAEDRAVLEATMFAADGPLTTGSTVCVDEWQKLPAVWDAIRRNVDNRVNTRYFLTGSASPSQGIDTHSGAGRILSIRMRPLSLAERGHTSPTVHIADMFEQSSACSLPIAGTSDFTLEGALRK